MVISRRPQKLSSPKACFRIRAIRCRPRSCADLRWLRLLSLWLAFLPASSPAMVMDSSMGARAPLRQSVDSGFHWVSPTPSPEVVKRLEELFPEVVVLPEEEVVAEAEGWLKEAVIVRSYQRWIPADAITREFRRAGAKGDIQTVSMAFRCHIFRFASVEARDLVIQRPWVVNGQVVGTEPWRAEFSPAEDSVSSVLIWVRLPNLPLEFWKADFIKAILQSAGDFVCLDPATEAKSRGAFARACLRLDLSRPLRPGARVQGTMVPFWQQFCFENLHGICDLCGSLHLGSPCAASNMAGEDNGGALPVYGPWLAAVRQRRPIPGAQSTEKVANRVVPPSAAPKFSAGGSHVGSMSQPEGWLQPKRVARRRVQSSVTKEDLVAPNSAGTRGKGEAPNSSGTRGKGEILQRAGCVSKSPGVHCSGVSVTGNSRELPVPGFPNSSNPFTILQGEPSMTDMVETRDGCSGPLKRSRPEYYPAPRHSPSIVKGKGKTKLTVTKPRGQKVGSAQREIIPPCCQVECQEVEGLHIDCAAEVTAREDLGPRSMMMADLRVSGSSEIASLNANSQLMSDDGRAIEAGRPDCTMIMEQGVALPSPTL